MCHGRCLPKLLPCILACTDLVLLTCFSDWCDQLGIFAMSKRYSIKKRC